MITFTGTNYSFRELLRASVLSEQAFKTATDPYQWKVTKAKDRWIFSKRPESCNIVKSGRKIIGFTYLIYTTKPVMRAFLNGTLSEEQLFQRSKQVQPARATAIYLCAAVILPRYRGKGFATQAFLQQLKHLRTRPTLFYWAYDPRGAHVAKTIARKLKLPLRARPDL